MEVPDLDDLLNQLEEDSCDFPKTCVSNDYASAPNCNVIGKGTTRMLEQTTGTHDFRSKFGDISVLSATKGAENGDVPKNGNLNEGDYVDLELPQKRMSFALLYLMTPVLDNQFNVRTKSGVVTDADYAVRLNSRFISI